VGLIIAAVAEETRPAIAGITATSQTESTAHLELLPLPFCARARIPVSLTGLLAPFENNLGVLDDIRCKEAQPLMPGRPILNNRLWSGYRRCSRRTSSCPS
jgi:hypothetical protein